MDWLPRPGDVRVHVAGSGQYVSMGIAYLICFTVYGWWVGWRLIPGWRSAGAPVRLPRVMLAGAFLSALVSFPTTTDVYTYLQAGLMTLVGKDPYVVPVGTLTTAISPFKPWGDTTAYGPISLALFATAGRLVATGPWGIAVAVYAYKVMCACVHLANGMLLRRTLSRARMPHADRITIAYLLCPPLLLDHVAQGHIDVLLCLSVIWLASALIAGRLVVATGAMMAGVLTKTLPIIWAPLLLVEAVRRRQVHKIVPMVGVAVAVASVATYLALHHVASWKSLLFPGAAWHSAGSLHNIAVSIASWLEGALPPVIKPRRVHLVLRVGTLAGFALFCVMLLWRRRRVTTPLAGVADMGWILLVLLLFATAWYQPWYATSLAPLVALTWFSSERYARLFAQVAAAYIGSSSAYYLLAMPQGTRFTFFMVSLLTVAPPLAVLVHHFGRWRVLTPQLASAAVVAVHPEGGVGGVPTRMWPARKTR